MERAVKVVKTVDKEGLIEQLLALPEEIMKAEEILIFAQKKLTEAKARLADAEAKLLIEGIEGKNAEQRAAILRQKTEKERIEVERIEEEVLCRKMNLNRRLNEFSALKAVARLLAKEAE